MYRILIAALTASLVQIAGAARAFSEEPAPAETPLNVSIKKILKDPSRYDGKLVRVRGTFDDCCRICEGAPPFPPRDRDHKTCMSVGLSSADALETHNGKQHRDLMELKEAWLAERNMHFATITLEGRYDSTCSSPDKICINIYELENARVVRVHVRRPASAAEVTRQLKRQYSGMTLIAPDMEETKALKAAFLTASPAAVSEEEKEPDFVFLDQPVSRSRRKEYGIEATGGACICQLEDCNAVQWPEHFIQTIDIPANPYRCWQAEKVGGVWKFPLQ